MLPEPTLKPAQCLDALEANLKTVLLHTGSALSEPSNFDTNHVSQTKARLGTHLPSALDEFNRALRNLELELIRAKSALTRDLTTSREARIAAASKANSANSPQPIDLDSDTVMIEAPTKKSESELEGQGTLTTQDPTSQTANGTDMELDSFEQAKTTGEQEQLGNTTAQQDHAIDGQPESLSQPAASLEQSNNTNGETSAATTKTEDTPASGDKANNQAEPSSATDGTNNTDDDLSLLFGVEEYATDESTKDITDSAQPPQADGSAMKKVDGEDAIAADEAMQGADQSQVEINFDLDNSNSMAEGLDFDFGTFDFGMDADNPADSNVDGTGQGDSQGWDSTFFDENFFNLDALN